MVLVNEKYPSDCIIFRYLVRPEQPQYAVAGHHETREAERASSSTKTSAQSLQLKPEKAQPIVTPSQSEGSDELAAARQLEVAAQKAAIERAKHARAANAEAKPNNDALDEVIAAAKEVEGLVGVVTEAVRGVVRVLEPTEEAATQLARKRRNI